MLVDLETGESLGPIPQDDPEYLVRKFDEAVVRGERLRKEGDISPEMKRAWEKFNNKLNFSGTRVPAVSEDFYKRNVAIKNIGTVSREAVVESGLTPEEIASAIKSGALSINEARELFGMMPLPESDDMVLSRRWEYSVYVADKLGNGKWQVRNPAPVEDEKTEPEPDKPKITTRKLEM